MPEMTLSEAAKWAGVGRPTIHKALTGKLRGRQLSGRQDETGQWRIDPSELARVFDPATAKGTGETMARPSPDIGAVMAGNERETALLREMLDEVRRERDDLRQDRDHWRDQAETQTRLLTHQQEKPTPATPAEVAGPTAPAPAAISRPGLLARLKAVIIPA